jgi:hypothetical protein
MTTLLGILLAIGCALSTNVGFLYKHRGACSVPLVDMRRPVRSAKLLFGSKLFAIGMLIASGAWAFHVAAMAVAPLSLVQAVLAGGMVLLAVMAERMLGASLERRQWVGIGATAIGLLALGMTLPAVHGAHSSFSIPAAVGFEGLLLGASALLIAGPRLGAPEEHHGFMLGAAAGILFGASDVSIKAMSGLIGAHGVLALISPWTPITVAASVAAFFASAKGLQRGDAVPVIAVTGTAANVGGILGGIIVFGDPLPADPAALVVQCLAIALVLVAAWMMPGPIRTGRAPRRAALAAAVA